MTLDLFPTNPNDNLLPYDGIVNDYSTIYDGATAQIIIDYLLTHIDWQHDEYIKNFANTAKPTHIKTARKVAWYADNFQSYTYAGSRKQARYWTPALLKLKDKVEGICGEQFNSCLANLYHSGDEGMGWHCDNEPEIKPNSAIASLSFGAERKFIFKHKQSGERIDLWLVSAQLIVMRGTTQKHWLHSVPKTSKVTQPRISLTFRQLVD